MDLAYDAEDEAFRLEVRQFVERSLPDAIRRKVIAGHELDKADMAGWQRILHGRGWGAPNWPVAFGGAGWSPVRQFIFDEECAMGGAPRLLPFGLKMVGPVIMAFGSPAQQQRFLPGMMSGEDWWCQGYSEPGAGSDLASLRTRAERRGDVYVVNGQKTWTTMAQHADWMFCLVRTDASAKPQQGISFLLIDMRSKGVTVRPIRLMDGGCEVNEVFLDNVEVPLDQRVGEENKGWTYAKYLLGHERTNIAQVGLSRRAIADLKTLAGDERVDGRPLMEDPLYAARLAETEIALDILEITNLRVVCEDAKGAGKTPGPAASILKLRGTEIGQAISELAIDALGENALPFDRSRMVGEVAGNLADPAATATPVAAEYLTLRKTSIYGGSNEIQKNIIAQSVLGL
ncbi:MAG: acyl-CoA dehydrogenase family protein [Methylobacteriaceae bacterium]|nr:acyl-CoA dehydrogenase family protein [Methylobacteriaceae bacterium]